MFCCSLKKKKFALVFAGGGGKGSYELGVFKAIKDLGLYKRIKAISATSVGAFNGCFFVQNDYNTLEYLWLNKVQDKIITGHSDSIIENLKTIFLDEDIKVSLKSLFISLGNSGILSRDGLLELIDEYLDLDKISTSKIDFFISAIGLDPLGINYFKVNKLDGEKIKSILLASSSIPVLFGVENIDGKDYIDGGIKSLGGSNVPIEPLLDAGYKNIIVIHLSPNSELEYHEGVNMYHIIPDVSLGSFINGVLDFSLDSTKERANLGYRDAMKVLCKIKL